MGLPCLTVAGGKDLFGHVGHGVFHVELGIGELSHLGVIVGVGVDVALFNEIGQGLDGGEAVQPGADDVDHEKASGDACQKTSDPFRQWAVRVHDFLLIPLDLGGDLREDQEEHDVGHDQGKAKVEALAADIEDQGLASFEVGFQLPEVGGQADAGKGQAEEPAPTDFGEAPDGAVVDDDVGQVLADGGVEGRERDGGDDEPDDEFGESVPDFNEPHLAAAGSLLFSHEVNGHTKGDDADEHVLDHLDGGGHVKGPLREEGAGRGHGARGVDGTAHPGAAQDVVHAGGLDDGGHDDHHDGGKDQGEANGQGQLLFFGPAGRGRGDGCRDPADAHVRGDGHVHGLGFDLQDLLAEPVGGDQHDGGHHPGHEDTGDTDGEDLVEKYLRPKEYQAGFDVVLGLDPGFHPLGGAHGVADDHAEENGPGCVADAVMLHGGVGRGHVSQHRHGEDKAEGLGEPGKGVSHEGDAHAEEEGQEDHEADEAGQQVVGFDVGLLLEAAQLGVGAAPVIDLLAGIGIEGGVAEVCGSGCGLGCGGRFKGFRNFGLARVVLHHPLGRQGLGVFGAQVKGGDGVAAPFMGLAGEFFDGLAHGAGGGLELFLGVHGRVPLNGLERRPFTLLGQGGVGLGDLGLDRGVSLGKVNDHARKEQDKAQPDGPVIFFFP